MKYKVGDKLRVKKGCESMCPTYEGVGGKYIKITSNGGWYGYDILNLEGNKLCGCRSCLTDEHLEPFEKTLENLEVGDMVADGTLCLRRVLGICGEVYLLSKYSIDNKDKVLKEFSVGYTVSQLNTLGYKPYTPPTTEIHELTIRDVAKLKGVDPSQIKIID